MTAEVIAISNHKGGVGKSVTAVNLAAGLARGGWRTLLVDCDAQGCSTNVFADEDDIEFDVYDVIKGGTPIRDTILTTRIDNLDLLPSTLEVAKLDQELVAMHRREDQLRRGLGPVLDDYDAILLDLPPNLGQLVITALNAADWIIVPVDVSIWGERGITMFLEWSAALRAAEVISADLLGVLVTKYEKKTLISRETVNSLQSAGHPLFDTVIPKRVATDAMIKAKLVIGDPLADETIAQAYAAFTVEVMSRVHQSRLNRGKHRA